MDFLSLPGRAHGPKLSRSGAATAVPLVGWMAASRGREQEMTRLTGGSADQVADYFINYLFDQYRGVRHVRRVASWIGLIVLGVERVAGQEWAVPRSRQLEFRLNGRRFKAKYNHRTGARGGIELVEVLPGRGSPEGRTVVTITSLTEAEAFYTGSERVLASFARSAEPA